MRFRDAIIGLLLLVLLASSALADSNHIQWSARLEPIDARGGESAQVVLTATLDTGWHVYSLTSPVGPDGGPLKTTFALKPDSALKADGSPVQPPFTTKHDDGFKLDVQMYSGAVAFGLPVKVPTGITGKQKAILSVRYQVCDAGKCLPPATLELPVEVTPGPGAARSDHSTSVIVVPSQPP